MANRMTDPPGGDPLMGAEFQPLRTLWEGANPPYPSEQSARWAIRQLDTRLAAAGALGLHRGMLYVHRQKLIEVARDHAIAQATKRYAKRA
jgi:hypothetical protein